MLRVSLHRLADRELIRNAAIVLAIAIALFSIYPTLVTLTQTTNVDGFANVHRAVPLWSVMQMALASLSGIALWANLVALAAVSALLLLLVSLITFFGVGLYVVIPAAVLVALIAVYSRQHMRS